MLRFPAPLFCGLCRLCPGLVDICMAMLTHLESVVTKVQKFFAMCVPLLRNILPPIPGLFLDLTLTFS